MSTNAVDKKKVVPDFRHGENIHCDRELLPSLNYDISLLITLLKIDKCNIIEFNEIAKNLDSCLPEQSSQADLNRTYIFSLFSFLQVQKPFYGWIQNGFHEINNHVTIYLIQCPMRIH